MDKIKVWDKEVEGEILLREEGDFFDRILFHRADRPEDEVDILYYNDTEGCWKSECESYGKGFEYFIIFDIIDEGYERIEAELRINNYKLVSCYEH